MLHTLCFAANPAIARSRAFLAALAVLEGTRNCRLACRRCRSGEPAFIYVTVLHCPLKLTWVPSGPLVLCDMFNAREPERCSRPVRRHLFNASRHLFSQRVSGGESNLLSSTVLSLSSTMLSLLDRALSPRPCSLLTGDRALSPRPCSLKDSATLSLSPTVQVALSESKLRYVISMLCNAYIHNVY